MTRALDLAVESAGQRYLSLEMDLRAEVQRDPAQAEAMRKAVASHPDPIARLMAQVVLDWSGGKEEDFKSSLAYLEYVPIRLKRTALGFPRPSGVESYLTLHFEDRVTELMALRLCKESGWPRWKVVGIILYLEAHKKASTTSALIRFAIETPNAEWRGFALEALRAIHDPALREKLSFEIARARAHDLAVPADVRALND